MVRGVRHRTRSKIVTRVTVHEDGRRVTKDVNVIDLAESSSDENSSDSQHLSGRNS